MLIYTVFILSKFLAVKGVFEDGFEASCDYNITLFAMKGEKAMFHVDLIHCSSCPFAFRIVIPVKEQLLKGMTRLEGVDDLSIDDRVSYTFLHGHSLDITLHDVVKDDNGMYVFELDAKQWRRMNSLTYCWELFVPDIWSPQGIQTFEEYRPAYIHASPRASRMVRQRVNATAIWLLDGLNFLQTTNFLEQDGLIIIISVLRNLDGKNVTYRIVEDNGDVKEVNLTLSVTYEQEMHITLSPDTMVYFLSAGETMPDIVCTVECHTVFNVRWNTLSSTNVLSLGTVTSAMSGEYTCSASREDSNKTVKRSVIVNVKDNTTLIIAAAVLGTVQGVTLICLGICAVYMYRASGRNGTCMTCKEKRESDTTRANMTNQHVSVQDISAIEMEHYEGLDHTQSGTNENYESLDIENVA